MKVLILAAGYGTRLYPLTKDKPKPLLEIAAGKPLINYLIEKVRTAQDLTEVYVVTNDKFYEKFSAWASDCGHFGIKITVVNDGTTTPENRLGSIGDIDFVVRTQNIQEDLLVIGGDNLFDFQTEKFFMLAKSQPQKVTLGVYDICHISEAKKFGVVAMGTDHIVTSFEEKPAQPKSSLIAMCFYYMPKATFPLIQQYVNSVGKLDLAGDYIRWLCEQKRLCGFQFLGSWYDIGSLEAYHQAQKDFQKNKSCNKEEQE